MKKITNTNEYTHSLGYQDTEGNKVNYVFQAGQVIEVPDEHEELFTGVPGFTVEESKLVVPDVEQKEQPAQEKKQEQEETVKDEPKKKEEVKKEETPKEKSEAKSQDGIKEENGTNTN